MPTADPQPAADRPAAASAPDGADPRIPADPEIGEHALRLCQALVRLDTTNPPGGERVAADLVAGELAAAGLDPVVLDSAPGRGNVVARLRGTGELPPLLLATHLDVVEADPDAWSHPPFSGDIADGCLWGRGAVDMKNMVAMSVAVMARLARAGARLRRDLIFAGVADEETGCDQGSAWLCANHPDLVRAEYAIGEGGGFNIFLGKTTVFTVQVAEKGVCWVRARATGDPGHGSMPREDSAVVRLAAALGRLGAARLPPHATTAVSEFLATLLGRLPAPLRPIAAPLVRPAVIARLLRRLPDRSMARALGAMLANTAAPTVVRAGSKTNVIPGVAEAEIDGRLLPGQTSESFLAELRDVLGPDIELEVTRFMPPVETQPIRSPVWDAIAATLAAREPDALVAPYLVPGFTDAKSFTRLGARWYGFAPVKLPRGMKFADLYHGHDERVPLEGLSWGTGVLLEVVQRVCGRAD